MAKRYLFFAVGALALTACTSEDVIDDVANSRNLISFENVVNKASRAPEIDNKNFKQFNVFGFYTMPENPLVANEVFENVPVTYNTEGPNQGKWTYNESANRYWVNGGKYYFYAYSCGNTEKFNTSFGKFMLDMTNPTNPDGTVGKDVTARKLEIDNYICDNTHQHDLVCAANTGTNYAGIAGLATGNSAVSFQFNHVLTKLKARFTTTFSSEYDVRISNVSINNIRNTGDYVFGEGWKEVTGNEDTNVTPYVNLATTEKVSETTINNYISVQNKIVGNEQMSVDTETAYAIPYDYFTANGGESATKKEIFIKFTVDVYFGAEKVMSKELVGSFNPNWQLGYSYVYNVEINGSTTNMEVITFTTATDADGGAITGWKEDETPVITINK